MDDIIAAAPVPNIDALLAPLPDLMGLSRADTSLLMTEEDNKPEWKLVDGLLGTAITLVQMAEGLGKSLLFLELALRAAWDPSEEELSNAISKSAYAGTTTLNEWMEAPLLNSGRTIYLAAEGKMSMHRKRANDILNNNIGVTDIGERKRLIDKVAVLSLRTFYHEIVDADQDLQRGLRLFRYDKKNEIWAPTALYNRILDYITDLHQRVDDGVAKVNSLPLNNEVKAAALAALKKERPVLLVIDTFGAVWGPRAVDDEGLQAVNQRVNADGDRLRICIPVIAHTNKAEDVNKDDHRAAGKGAIEMHSTVENQQYGRGANEAEMKALQTKGEGSDPDLYLAFRIGKTNLQHVDRDTRLLKRIPAGAPVCITRKLGLTGKRIGGQIRNGFEKTVILDQLQLAVERLGSTSAAGIWKAIGTTDGFAKDFPALVACAKEGSASGDDWKVSALLEFLAGEDRLVKTENRRGKLYLKKETG